MNVLKTLTIALSMFLLGVLAVEAQSSVVVTNPADSGPGTLREAVTLVPTGGTITFAPSVPSINLTSQISINKTITINGPVSISGVNQTRLFNIGVSGSLAINNVTLSNGFAQFAGAIYNQGQLTAADMTFLSNTSVDNGGALVNDGSARTTRVRFIDNPQTIYNRGTLTIQDSSFTGGSTGRALVNEAAAQMLIVGITVYGLSAGDGAPVINRGNMSVSNSTLFGNFGGQSGGIFNQATLVIANSSLVENTGVFSTSVRNLGSLTLRNTLLTSDSGVADCVSSTALLANTSNLIGQGDANCPATLLGDPLVGTLGNNGGPTLTVALLPGSPAIDAGDAASCTATDQRGVSRISDNFPCDVGAYETDSTLSDPITITPMPSLTNTPTSTPTHTPTSTPTNTPTSTPTNTPTSTPTNTPTFTPTNTPMPTEIPLVYPAVLEFMLVDANANRDIRPLVDGDTIVLANNPPLLNIRAITQPMETGSVLFYFPDGEKFFREEGVRPYALAGDRNGNYNVLDELVPGSYTLNASAFTASDGHGQTGTPKTISFDVVETASVVGFELVNALTGEVIAPLDNGAVIDTAFMPPNVSIRALTVPENAGPVQFDFQNVTAFSRDTDAPYFLNGADAAGNPVPVRFTMGDYTLSAAPELGGLGTTVEFSVVQSGLTFGQTE